MSRPSELKVASVQFCHKPGDKDYNLSIIEHFCQKASEQGVQLLCFPEMCITGYWHVRKLSRSEVAALAEPVPDGPSTKALMRLAEQYKLTISAGLIEKEASHLFNTQLIVEPSGNWTKHRKLHTFISHHMSSGDSYTVFDSDLGVKLGVLTCWDNNLVENVRATALLGAEIIIAPHQTGGCNSRSPRAMGLIDPELWHNREQDPESLRSAFLGKKGRGWLMRWLPSRAHDNGVFYLFSNGVGLDDDEVRTGNAMIIDCYGEILAETSSIGDDMVVACLDLTEQDMCTGQRWIKGRRPNLYGPITEVKGNELDPVRARFGDNTPV